MSAAESISVGTPRARANGWWGMAIFAAAEATVFGSVVGSYFYLRLESPHWPPAAIPEPSPLWPSVLTAVLIASVVPFRAAIAAARRGLRGRAWALVALSGCVQAAYLAAQIHLLESDLARFSPKLDAYASIYYVLLGLAHAHIALGLLFDLWLVVRLSTGLTRYRLVALEAVGLYWVVVAGITVVVVLTELSPRL